MSASATPTVIAGRAFSLSADTDVVGYDNTPQANPSCWKWLNVPTGGRASPGTGTLGGSFSTAASAATGNGASGSFTYDEVGYFRFKENGVFDDTFTSYSGRQGGRGLCDGMVFRTPRTNGKHGCNFGNTEVSDHFGRFIPDHFDTSVTQACVRDDFAVESFTYSGQPFPLTITARNQAGGEAANYSGAFARQVSLTARRRIRPTTPVPGSLSLTNVPASAFSGGIARANPSYAFHQSADGADSPCVSAPPNRR